MATEHFCLRWNNHQSTLVSVFDNLLESGTLVDCTLAADGRYLKAHKVVLSACSPYLGMLLSQHHDKHPIIILKDVKFEELKAMLDYMYRGEVNISQEQLTTFLKAAESLQIKGLTDTGGEEGLQPIRPPSSNSTVSVNNEEPASPGDGGSPSRKRKRNRTHDELPDCETKLTISDGSGSERERSSAGTPTVTKTSVGVKREPTDTDGDGQMNLDESGDSAMLSRPGPSNGSSTNNKGSPWLLSGDNSDEMQLTPGQDDEPEDKFDPDKHIKEENVSAELVTTKVKEEPFYYENYSEFSDTLTDPLENYPESNQSNETVHRTIIVNKDPPQHELIVPDIFEEDCKKFTQDVNISAVAKVSRKSRYFSTTRVLRSSSFSPPDSLNVNKKTEPSSTAKKAYGVSQMFKCKYLVKKKPLQFPKYRKILPAEPVNGKESSLDENTLKGVGKTGENSSPGKLLKTAPNSTENNTILSFPCSPRDTAPKRQSHFVPVSAVNLTPQTSSVSTIALPTQQHFTIPTTHLSQQISTSQGNQLMIQPRFSSPNFIRSPVDPNIFLKNIGPSIMGALGGISNSSQSHSQFLHSQMVSISQSISCQSSVVPNSLVLNSSVPGTSQSPSIIQRVSKTSKNPVGRPPKNKEKKLEKPKLQVRKNNDAYKYCTPSRPVKILPKPSLE